MTTAKITYTDTPTGAVKVKLDGSYVGSIVRNGTYWHYKLAL